MFIKMGNYVYKYVYDNEIIYIGKNDTDLTSRLNRHGKPGDNIPEEGWDEINNSDIFYCELANRIMSDVVESELIRRYKPKYNKAKTSEWSGLEFVEPKWEKYNKEKLSNKRDTEYKFYEDQIETDYDRTMRIINGGKETLTNEINLLIDKMYNLRREIRFLKDIKKENFVMKKIRVERRYSNEEMINFYQYLNCDSNVKFTSTVQNENGNTLCHVEFWCENKTVKCKLEYYDEDKKDYVTDIKLVCEDEYIRGVVYFNGSIQSTYGLVAETNNHYYINDVIVLSNYKKLNIEKEKLIEDINTAIKIDCHCGRNISYKEFIENIDFYQKYYWSFSFSMHNNQVQYDFCSYKERDGWRFNHNLICIKKEKNLLCNGETIAVEYEEVDVLDNYKEFKFDVTYRLKSNIEYYKKNLEAINHNIRNMEIQYPSLFVDRYDYSPL